MIYFEQKKLFVIDMIYRHAKHLSGLADYPKTMDIASTDVLLEK